LHSPLANSGKLGQQKNDKDFFTVKVLSFELSSGVTLTAHAYGDPSHPPVILSHGGGQTRHSWGGTAEQLARQGWYAVAYDHRGHGNSSWSEDGDYHIDRFVEDQRELAKQFERPPVLVGASLGGISAMLAQGEADTPIFSAVVLVDIVPRMNQEGAVNVLSFMRHRMEEGFASLDEAADIIAEYTGRPRRKDVSGLKKNLRLDDDGRYRWHWDPQFVLQRPDKKHMTQHDRLDKAVANIALPILLVRGKMSDLVTEELAEEFLQMVPHAKYVDVEDARHMVAGDRNDIFSSAVLDFLSDLNQHNAA
jgi:pimeloyl-ACP methyl ester carboxylesterase